ncbi:MAG: OmpH family outer membrane protein [Saprospiraceae bacterium]
MKQVLFSLLFMTATLSVANAQKFGYINSQELLAGMSEMKLADNAVKTLQNELVAQGEALVIKFEAEYKAYMTEVNGGTLSKVQAQQKEQVLIGKQDEIKKFEENIQLKVETKRQELYQPILDKVKAEIEKLGKEGGYVMIFDTSSGVILHAADSENLMATIKTKLGVN